MESILSAKARLFKASEVRELLKVTEGKNIICFTGGFPDPQVFPKRELAEVASYVIEELGDRALQYGPTKGVTEFRDTLKRFLMNKGVKIESDDDIIITTGSQQALDLISQLLINPGDTIVVELPTYLAALNAFKSKEPNIIPIPMDENGMRTDILEEEVRKLKRSNVKVKFIYTIPVAHNPTGITMSMDRKKHLLDIASEYDLIIIEDDPYSYFVYDEGIDVTPLKTLDKEGRVVYLSTLSKILAPGLRVGWVLGNNVLVDYIERAKQSADLHTSTLNQFIAMEAIKRGIVDRTIVKAKEVYRVKRDVMIDALEKYMVKGTKWVKPVGGLFMLVWLPSKSIDTKKLLPEAIKEGVAYVPGSAFFADGSGQNTIRLNFSYPKPEEIVEGIKILGNLIKRKLSSS
ncbi:MAG: aminotransferase [Desulfurococcales archaeon ex4484_42]|nr:MAG: aminotransferase [Desulfurococcales archaeon ex4484_42]